jgi:dihydroorotase
MSKLLNCGVPIADAVAMVTDAPARAMRRPDLGHLSVGAVADISLIERIDAHFPFVDVVGVQRESTSLLCAHGVFLQGVFVAATSRDWEAPFYRGASGTG